jgi:predicted transcriptional regulator of viral defense system
MKNNPDYNCLFEIAEDQAGYFSSSQAVERGFSWERLSNSVKSGKFRRVSSGIYRFQQYPESRFEDLFIALLKTGKNSVLSHVTALSVYQLSDALPGEIHVTIPRTASRRRPGIKFHTKSIGQNEITLYEGLRITTVERTIIDLFESGFDPGQLRQAVDQALERGLTTKPMLINAMNSRGKFKQRKFENITSLRLS